MSKANTVDMTKGNPLPILIKFAVPLVLGSIFQQCFVYLAIRRDRLYEKRIKEIFIIC